MLCASVVTGSCARYLASKVKQLYECTRGLSTMCCHCSVHACCLTLCRHAGDRQGAPLDHQHYAQAAGCNSSRTTIFQHPCRSQVIAPLDQ